MTITNYRVDVLTDAGGAATAYSNMPVNGKLLHMRYIPDGTSPLDTGADITVTGESSGIAIVTKANIGTSAFTLAPRQPTHNASDGSAALYAAAGTAVNAKIALAGERIKVVVAQGGNALKGQFQFVVDDD